MSRSRTRTGREWHVKQPPHNDQGAEGPIEVTLSRVLSAVGYHQPPVYFLPAFSMKDAKGIHVEPGGRFRLTDKSIEHVGEWSWQQNPFVGMRPYQGLLVILMMFNSSDIKNENNALYEVKKHGGKASSSGMSCATSARPSARPGAWHPSAATPRSSSASRSSRA